MLDLPEAAISGAEFHIKTLLVFLGAGGALGRSFLGLCGWEGTGIPFLFGAQLVQ